MLPLAFLLACTGIGLIPVGIILISYGNRTFNACPQCKSQNLLEWTGQPSPECQAIWTKAKEADDNAFKKNRLVLFGFAMAMLAAALVFMVVMMRNM